MAVVWPLTLGQKVRLPPPPPAARSPPAHLISFWEAKHQELPPVWPSGPSSQAWVRPAWQETHFGLSGCTTASHIYLLICMVEPTASGRGLPERCTHTCPAKQRLYFSPSQCLCSQGTCCLFCLFQIVQLTIRFTVLSLKLNLRKGDVLREVFWLLSPS